MTPDLIRLTADVDQDRAELEAWWNAHSDDDKLAVWLTIQKAWATHSWKS